MTAVEEDDDNLTLEEYLEQLSDSDKKLLKGFPLTVDEIIDTDYEELAKLKNITIDLTEEQQAIRLGIISKILYLRTFAKVERAGKRNQWNYNNINQESKSKSKSKKEPKPKNGKKISISKEHYSRQNLIEKYVVPTWKTKVTQGSEYAFTIANMEDPSRAITQLRNLARGHALSRRKEHITVDDIPIVIHTVLSTASAERVKVFELLIESSGELSTGDIVRGLPTTYPTAKRAMTELKAVGLVDMYPDITDDGYEHREDGTTVYVANAEKTIMLTEKFKWFLTEEFANLRDKTEEGLLKEKCTPRISPLPLLIYDYHIIKKLN